MDLVVAHVYHFTLILNERIIIICGAHQDKIIISTKAICLHDLRQDIVYGHIRLLGCLQPSGQIYNVEILLNERSTATVFNVIGYITRCLRLYSRCLCLHLE
ncbi:hypothetical protein D3C80_1878840 [compost metagenome]